MLWMHYEKLEKEGDCIVHGHAMNELCVSAGTHLEIVLGILIA